MADIQYLNYGDLQIELLALLNTLANNVQSYVAKQPWSNKRKEKFMSAYSDIMNNGLLGASNTSGQWMIDVGGTIDLDSKSKKDKEMYLEAAYFIQLQMAGLPTKSSLEKKDESELPKYDSFINNFSNYLSLTYYGGNPIRTQEDWNILDERNPNTGLRGTDKRVKKLSDYLKAYSNSLEEGKYNFEGSPFKDLTDLKTRINNAITKLDDGTWNLDDTDALNAIGLRSSDWFNNGSGDPVTLNGTTTTYGLLAEYNRKIAEAKLKLEEANKIAELKAIRANQYDSYRFLNFLNGTPGTKEEFNLIGLKLAGQQKLDGNDISRISWAFRQGMKNGGLSNLSKEELVKFGPRYINTPNRLKKLSELEGIYYDSFANRLIQPFKGLQLTGANLSGILELNSPEALQLKQLTTPRQLSDGLKYEDYARIGAALGDVISLGGFGANIAGSVVSLLGDTSADIVDDKVSNWEAFKNFGKNLGWTVAGFIPGAKLGKVAKNIMRWAPKMLVALNDYNLLNDESNKNTWNKLTNESRLLKEGLNDEDLKNITYWVRAFTGTANAIKATGRDIKYSKARGTTGLKFKTKDGTEVLLSDKAVAEINIAGAKKGLKAAEAKFKEKVKEATGQEHEVADGTFKFSENGRKYFSNTRSKVQDLRLQGESVVFRTPEQQRYYDLLLQDRSLGGLGGWRPFWLRGTSSYFDYFDKGSFKNPLNGILRKVDPYKNMINSLNQSGNNQTNPLHQNNSLLNQQRTREIPDNFEATSKAPVSPKHNLTRNEWKKKNKKLYNSINKKGRFTNNMPEEGTYEFKDPTGNTHTFKLIQRDDDFLLDIKSSNGSSRQAVLTLDLVKKGIWENIKLSLNTGLRNDISLPANIIRTLQSTAYSWLKLGGRIDKQKIQRYKEFIKK